MDKEKLTYIEETGLVFEQLGMTRMAGRVFGFLAVSDKEEASFDDIREGLNASKGSISGTAKQLKNAGLIEPVSLPGDRKTYYRISKMEVGNILRARLTLFKTFSDNLEKGLILREKNDEIAGWLREVSAFYSWVGDKISDVISTWETEKKNIIKEKNPHEKIRHT